MLEIVPTDKYQSEPAAATIMAHHVHGRFCAKNEIIISHATP